MASIKRRSLRRGTMAVEAAILMPLIVFFTLFLLEYSWYFLKSEQIANAARHGARVGARIDATDGDVQTAVADLMNKAGIVSYPTPVITHGTMTMPSGKTQDVVTVRIEVPFKDGDLDWFKTTFIWVPEHIRSSVTMAKEST